MMLSELPRSTDYVSKDCSVFTSHFLLSPTFMMYNFIVGNCTLKCDLKTVLLPGLKSSLGSKPIPSLPCCLRMLSIGMPTKMQMVRNNRLYYSSISLYPELSLIIFHVTENTLD